VIYFCLYCKRYYVLLIENCVRYVDHYEGLQEKNGVCSGCTKEAYIASSGRIAANDA